MRLLLLCWRLRVNRTLMRLLLLCWRPKWPISHPQSLLRTLEELQKPQVADERILRFFRYLQAARTGQDGGDCLEKYNNCAQDTTRLSHKPILDAFYKVSDLMNHEPYWIVKSGNRSLSYMPNYFPILLSHEQVRIGHKLLYCYYYY